MDKRNLVAYLRIGFSLLVAAALAVQVYSTLEQGRNLLNFFSFFTIQSNIIAGVVLLIVGAGTLLNVKANRQFAFIRGAATLYMVITGIVFALLLAGLAERLQLTVPWVNMVLHYLIPIVMLVDWLLFATNINQGRHNRRQPYRYDGRVHPLQCCHTYSLPFLGCLTQPII